MSQFKAVADYFTDVVHDRDKARRKKTQIELRTQGPVKTIMNSSESETATKPQLIGEGSASLSGSAVYKATSTGSPNDTLSRNESIVDKSLLSSGTVSGSVSGRHQLNGNNDPQSSTADSAGMSSPIHSIISSQQTAFRTKDDFTKYVEENAGSLIYGTCFVEQDVLNHLFRISPNTDSPVTFSNSSTSSFVQGFRSSINGAGGGGLDSDSNFKLTVAINATKTVRDVTKSLFSQLLRLKTQTTAVTRVIPHHGSRILPGSPMFTYSPILNLHSSYLLIARGYPTDQPLLNATTYREELSVFSIRVESIALGLLYCDILLSVCDANGVSVRPLRRAVKNKRKLTVDMHGDDLGAGTSSFEQSHEMMSSASSMSIGRQKTRGNFSSSKSGVEQGSHLSAAELYDSSIIDANCILEARYVERELVSSQRSILAILKSCDLLQPPFLFSLGSSELCTQLHAIMVDEARKRLLIESEKSELDGVIGIVTNMFHTDVEMRLGWYSHEQTLRRKLYRAFLTDRSEVQQSTLQRMEINGRLEIEELWKTILDASLCLERERLQFACSAYDSLSAIVVTSDSTRRQLQNNFDSQCRDMYAADALESKVNWYIENVLTELSDICWESMLKELNREITNHMERARRQQQSKKR